MMAAHPNLMPPPHKALISQRAALVASVRLWFFHRDEAILRMFVSGDLEEKPLIRLGINDEISEHLEEANAAYEQACKIAQRIATENEQKASTVMRDAINELLAAERPQFLLSIPNIPGSF